LLFTSSAPDTAWGVHVANDVQPAVADIRENAHRAQRLAEAIEHEDEQADAEDVAVDGEPHRDLRHRLVDPAEYGQRLLLNFWLNWYPRLPKSATWLVVFTVQIAML
jgi:hypothetical protein